VVDSRDIRDKFGDDFSVTDHTFKLGIRHRFTAHIAERFRSRELLETCTGAGFATISLARAASHVTTVEINLSHQEQARRNMERSGLSGNVTFVSGDILDENLLRTLPPVDAAFLDPDWADTEPDHQYRFVNSNTLPPADALLERILRITGNVALVLPPCLNVRELDQLPVNEREKLYLDGSHELYCLYFGQLIKRTGETEFRVTI
jgi:tRNA1(Val) A37 N6-methylase TrmN6